MIKIFQKYFMILFIYDFKLKRLGLMILHKTTCIIFPKNITLDFMTNKQK